MTLSSIVWYIYLEKRCTAIYTHHNVGILNRASHFIHPPSGLTYSTVGHARYTQAHPWKVGLVLPYELVLVKEGQVESLVSRYQGFFSFSPTEIWIFHLLWPVAYTSDSVLGYVRSSSYLSTYDNMTSKKYRIIFVKRYYFFLSNVPFIFVSCSYRTQLLWNTKKNEIILKNKK